MQLPKDPRQKMINLMYLVLTALLALNVSSEILNAFKTVNKSLEKTSNIINTSTGDYMAALERKTHEVESQQKALHWFKLATDAKSLSDNIYDSIKTIKDSLLSAVDFNPAKNKDSAYKDDDIEAAQRLIVEGGMGQRLHAWLNGYRLKILAIDSLIKGEMGSSMPLDITPPVTKNRGNNTWEAAYFTMAPTDAALTILSKFQNDIRSTENRVVQFCLKKVGEVIIPFDTYAPMFSQSSSYVMNGQPITISAGLGAFNSKNQPIVTIEGEAQRTGTDGLVTRTIIANGVGEHLVHVSIAYKDEDGQARQKDETLTYTVGQPAAFSISTDATRILYADLDNPVSVGSGSVGSERVTVNTDNGTVRRGTTPGQWYVTPAHTGLATLSANINGTVVSQALKVKSVPDPIAEVGNLKGGRVPANLFKSQAGVYAVLEDFFFDSIKFTITNYTIFLKDGPIVSPIVKQDISGGSFAPVRQYIDKAGPGTSIIIDDIKAAGPGGTRKLPPLVFTLY